MRRLCFCISTENVFPFHIEDINISTNSLPLMKWLLQGTLIAKQDFQMHKIPMIINKEIIIA